MELTPEQRASLPHYDQQPTKPSSEEPLVLVYCKKCRKVVRKDGIGHDHEAT